VRYSCHKISARIASPAFAATKIGIELPVGLGQIARVKATIKRRAKSEAALVGHATNNLLRALKQDMLRKDGRVDREKLRKDGYSNRLLDRLVAHG
jgi:hypothetical protein